MSRWIFVMLVCQSWRMNVITYSPKIAMLVMRYLSFTSPFNVDCWMVCQYCKAINFIFLQISITNLEMCSLELVKHFFNRDTEALNVRILVCIFWGIVRVQSSCIKQNPVVCNCHARATSVILLTSILRICHAACYISVIYPGWQWWKHNAGWFVSLLPCFTCQKYLPEAPTVSC